MGDVAAEVRGGGCVCRVVWIGGKAIVQGGNAGDMGEP